jgi:hypothetical protein
MTRSQEKPRNSARRLDRRNAAERRREQARAKILKAMRAGAELHRCNGSQRVIWTLSTGEFVTAEAAADVLGDVHVAGAGDCLFGPWPELSQTFRYVDDNAD